MIIYSPNPTFVLSLREIGDLSCITSCLVLPGFLMDTLLKAYRLSVNQSINQLINRTIPTNSLNPRQVKSKTNSKEKMLKKVTGLKLHANSIFLNVFFQVSLPESLVFCQKNTKFPKLGGLQLPFPTSLVRLFYRHSKNRCMIFPLPSSFHIFFGNSVA